MIYLEYSRNPIRWSHTGAKILNYDILKFCCACLINKKSSYSIQSGGAGKDRNFESFVLIQSSMLSIMSIEPEAMDGVRDVACFPLTRNKNNS